MDRQSKLKGAFAATNTVIMGLLCYYYLLLCFLWDKSHNDNHCSTS